MKGPWQKETFRLPENHGFTASPGNAIFVADRGAVRFEYPASWTMEPTDDALEFRDRPPPDDECILKFSLMRLNPQIDWSGVPLAELLPQVLIKDSDGQTLVGKVKTERRGDMQLAWLESASIDPKEQREGRCRACLALRGNIMPFITLDFWPEDSRRLNPVWRAVLRTLRIGEYETKLTGKDPRHWASLDLNRR